MRRLAAVVLGASLLALPACGGKTDEASRAAGITPVDALALVSVNLDPSVEQKRNLLGIVRRFPDARDEVKGEFDEARDDLLAELLDDSGLDFQRDVQPWLGNEVAVAVLPPGDGDVPLVVAMVETDDAAKARAAIEKAKAGGDFEGVYGIAGDFVVISDQESDADDQRALDLVTAQAGKSDGGLADSEAFTSVVDELHGDRLFLAWADVKASVEAAEQAGALADLEFLDALGADAGPVAVDVHAEDDAFVLQGVAAATGGTEGTRFELTRSLPEATLAALTLFNVGSGVADGIRALTGADSADFMAEFEDETGLNLEDDLLSWMQGELVLVAGAVPSGQDLPDFALVVEPSDRAKARAGVEKIRDVLGEQGFELEEREIEGATAYVAPDPIEGMQPAMALFPDRFVLATRAGYLAELAKGDSPGLAGSDAYTSVLGDDAPDDTTMQFVALLDPIREALEKALLQDAEARAEYEEDLKPNVEPLAAFGVVARRDGDFSKVELKLTFD